MKQFLMVTIIVFIAANVFAVDKYWISIGGDNSEIGPTGKSTPIFLLQIDENGTVTKAPQIVVPVSQLSKDSDNEKPTAMSYDAHGNILLFYGQDRDNDVHVATIDKNNLSLISLRRVLTGLTDLNWLQVTQPFGDVLASENPDGIMRGFRMNLDGIYTNSKFRLSPRSDAKGGNMKASIAPDGGMSAVFAHLQNVKDKDPIYLQPLRPDDRLPLGTPAVILNNGGSLDIDISNLLPNGTRIVVYDDDAAEETYFLQVVNGSTGQKIGQRKLLTSRISGEVDGQMAVDPKGRFAIFNVNGDDAGCDNDGKQPLFFQKLNPSTGDPVGSAFAITSCNLYSTDSSNSQSQFGIDILQVQ